MHRVHYFQWNGYEKWPADSEDFYPNELHLRNGANVQPCISATLYELVKNPEFPENRK